MRIFKLFVYPVLIIGLLSGWHRVEANLFLDVEGMVDPFNGTIINNGDGTSTISQLDYIFTVLLADMGAEMDALNLHFEHNVFSDVGMLPSTTPADWTTSFSVGSNITFLNASAGTTIAQGGSFRFSLLNVVIFNNALNDRSFWNEGQVWAQSFFAADFSPPPGTDFLPWIQHTIDGGSTAVVSEPNALLLFGVGLLVFGGMSRVHARRERQRL